MGPRRVLLRAAILIGLAALAAPSATAGAVIPGPNGPIVFTSGRGQPSDSTAQIWIVDQPGGSPVQVTNNPALQHRHATWSPEGTKIAYAAGTGFMGPFDIYVHDLTQPLSASNPINLTQSAATSEDRPAWSPDGTRIAYGRDVMGDFNIWVQSATGGLATPITVAVAQDAEKPAWSPDSKTIFYQLDVGGGSAHDIYKKAADGSGVATAVVTGNEDDYQPALSPDGQNLCFTRGPFFTNAASVQRSTSTGASVMAVADSGYNCVWSPDGTKIAYAQGALTTAALVMKNSDGSQPANTPGDPVVNDAPDRFDGNPDWAPRLLAGGPGGGGGDAGGGGGGGRGPGVVGTGGPGGDAGPCGGGGAGGGAVGSGGGGAGGGGCFGVGGVQRLAAGAVVASAGVATDGSTIQGAAFVDMGRSSKARSSRLARVGRTIMRGLKVGRYKVVVRLSAKGKRRLKRMRKPKVRLRLVMTAPTGRPLIVTRNVTLKR